MDSIFFNCEKATDSPCKYSLHCIFKSPLYICTCIHIKSKKQSIAKTSQLQRMAFEVRSRTENVLHSAPLPPPFPLTSPPSHWRLGSYCLYGNVGNQGSDTPRGQRPTPKILLNSLPTPFPKQVSMTCFLKSHTHTGILVQQDRLGCSDRSTQGWIYSQNTRVGSLSN